MAINIERLTTAAGTGNILVFPGPVDEPFISLHPAVNGAIAAAFTLRVPVDIEAIDGTHIIRRVAPFTVPGSHPRGHVSRIATQMNPDTGENWMEVFISAGNGSDKAYRAF